jgi:protocatechuate 3,4-dioxygenase beta subunit
MVIKNSELNSESIQELNNLIDMDINAASAFKLMRIIKELSSLVDDKLKLEKKIFDKYVEKDAEGKPVLAKDEAGEEIPNAVRITDMEAFNNEMLKLNLRT